MTDKIREALRAIVEEAELYRKDNTPECYLDSGPYCGVHSFLEYSELIDRARSLLDSTEET